MLEKLAEFEEPIIAIEKFENVLIVATEHHLYKVDQDFNIDLIKVEGRS